jgi:2',3'-cyclic-nucleotide 2'-phosphodiesterase (5'-nucleotidase family)
LDPAREYTVASSAFLANGGDDYSMLAAGKVLRKSPDRLSRAFIDYFKRNSAPEVPEIGRQVDRAREPESADS